jgi:serine/threonine protein kinase
MFKDQFQLKGKCLDGKFRVDRVVIEGDLAVVYAGQHLILGRGVAIKVLKTPALNGRAENFALEAETVAELIHSNIVEVIDFGVSELPSSENRPWIVSEWLAGRSLEHDLRRRRGQGGRTPAEALSLLEPIFEALAYAHKKGIAHRNVKPAHIIFVASNRGELPKLFNFGIGNLAPSAEPLSAHSMMSAHSMSYAAPEQLMGVRTGPWTDVHALGLLLTEALTDQPPYLGRDTISLRPQILSSERPTPSRFGVNVGSWEAVLAKALSFVPSDRFEDASEFLATLKSEFKGTVKTVPLQPEATTDGKAQGDDNYLDIDIADDIDVVEIDIAPAPEPSVPRLEAVAPALQPSPPPPEAIAPTLQPPPPPPEAVAPALQPPPPPAEAIAPAIEPTAPPLQRPAPSIEAKAPTVRPVVTRRRQIRVPRRGAAAGAGFLMLGIVSGYFVLAKPRIPQAQAGIQTHLTPGPVPAQAEKARGPLAAKKARPTPLPTKKNEATPPLAAILADPSPAPEVKTPVSAAKESPPAAAPQVKSKPVARPKLSKRRVTLEPDVRKASAVRRSARVVSRPTPKPVRTEKQPANRQTRSSKKALHQTNVELE